MHRLPIHRLLVALTIALVLLPATAPGTAHAQARDEEIVYLDDKGVIRVRDPNPIGSRAPVTWFSPTGSYTDLALVDVNGDRDMEIAALRNESGAFQLDIYDPVVTTAPIVPGQSIGGIPWLLLFSMEMEDEPALIAAGNLDAGIPGDEIFVTERQQRQTPGGLRWRQDLFYLQNIEARDGRAWRRIDLPITGEDWSSTALGDMDRDGIDEIGLVATSVSDLHIWKMTGNGGAQRIYDNESNDRRWRHLAMGNFRGDGRDLLGAVRTTAIPDNSLIVLRLSSTNNQINDDFVDRFAPSPSYIFFGDVNGSGDDEAYMLRSVPVSNTVSARLFMRQRGSDAVALLEDRLDSDNGFQAGAAGDIDGDGRDEVVLLRPNRLRYYLSPDTSVSFTEESLTTDGRTIVIGDLDRAGFVQEIRLTPTTTSVRCNAPAGAEASPVTFQVTNGTNSDALPFAFALESRQPWVRVTADRTTTPATLTVSCSAAQLVPGIYSTAILLTSSNPFVLTQPVRVDLQFFVTDGLVVRPPGLVFVQYPCGVGTAIQSQTVDLIAPQGTQYSVSLVRATPGAAAAAGPAAPNITWPSSVPWASATSASGLAPESLTITVDFGQRTADVEEARAVIIATVDGSTQVRTLPITLLCAASQVPLPSISF